MAEIVSPTTSIIENPDGTFTAMVGGGQRWYRDDNDLWVPVHSGSDSDLPGNCEFVPIAGGYRMWSPHGKPPYNPEWLPTDYWLQVEDLNGVTDCAPQRATVSERVTLATVNSTRPTWKWTWSANLTYQGVVVGLHTWVDSTTGGVVFTKRQPMAWSEADPLQIARGTATVGFGGLVTVDIDLSSLSYPIIVDPTTVFSATSGDGRIYVSNATWAGARDAVNGDAAENGLTNINAGIVQYNGSSYLLGRCPFMFDLSSLAGAIVSSTLFSLFKSSTAEFDTGTSNYSLVETTIVSTTTLDVSDYNKALYGTTKLATDKAHGTWTLSAYNDLTLNAAGLAVVTAALGGTVKLAIRGSRDVDDSAPAGVESNYAGVDSSEGTNDPQLSVTYTLPSGGARGLKRGSMQRVLMLP